MMVEDGNLEVLKLLSSTSSKIAQGEVLQLQHNNEVDMLEETYLKIISAKTAELFAASTKVPRPKHWSGWNLNPQNIEFWLDGENRIHERLLYTKSQNGLWNKALLSP